MSTHFERVKRALDILMPRLTKLLGPSADARVGKRCGELRRAYQGRLLERGREPVDYSRPSTQVAYVYRTMPAHADWVSRALGTVPLTMQNLLNRGHLRVACIGGGPGTDILGVVRYAEDNGFEGVNCSFVVLDHEMGWNTPRRVVAETCGENVSHDHQHLDLTEVGTWTDNWEFTTADLFTFSFSLSEVWCYNTSGAVSAFLRELVKRAKSGALFVYVDNGGENFTSLVEKELGSLRQLKLVAMAENEQMRLSYSERRDVLEDAYMARFGNERVKMGGNVAIRIWQKK